MNKLYLYKDNGEKQNIDFVTSDHHFGHENIIRYAQRTADNLEEMHKYMISQWNSVVEPHHTVLHLGDTSLGLHEETVKNYAECNGKKFLIPGNHDPISILKSKKLRENKRVFFEEQFTILGEEPRKMELVFDDGQPIILFASHYPHDDGTDYQKKYRKLNLFVPDNQHLIHGHTHSHEAYRISPDGILAYHVGVDSHDYVPVSVDKLAEVFIANDLR